MLGAVQHRMGRLHAAASSFRRAIAAEPAFVEGRTALAVVLHALGKVDAAEAELREVLVLDASNAQAHHNLAVLLAEQGEGAAALESYDAALRIDPAHREARANRASLRLACKQAQGALEDYASLQRMAPDRADVRAGFVRALLLLHRDEEALHAADELIRLHPAEAIGWRLKATAAASLHRLVDATSALAQCGEPGSALSIYIERALDRQDVCDWHDRSLLLETLRTALVDGAPQDLWQKGLIVRALALPLDSRELALLASQVGAFIRDSGPRVPTSESRPRKRNGRIRVGFITPDVRDHPGAYLLWPLLRDRDGSRFEYYLYALAPDDRSEIRRQLAASADVFADVSAWTSEAIIRRVRDDELDLLVDKSNYFEGTRPELLAQRMAPVQLGYLGTACTMGPGFLDYRLTDDFTVPPGNHQNWAEHLVVLPQPHWAYDVARNHEDPGTRAHWGLPERAFVFCCFNQALKISPEIFAIWMRLLKKVAGSVLWLLDPGELARRNLAREADSAGIAAERLVYAPRVALEAHLGRQAHADLFLDTRHWGAHTTGADALHAGVPVLTCPGDTMAARMCATLVRNAGLEDLVVPDLVAYEAKALEIAIDREAAARLRGRLAEARGATPFFQVEERVRWVERAFAAVVERHRAGLAATTIRLA